MECTKLNSYTGPSSVNNELVSNKKNQAAIYLEDKQNTEYSITNIITFFFRVFFYHFFNSGETHDNQLLSNCLVDPYNYSNIASIDLLLKKSDQFIDKEYNRSGSTVWMNSLFVPYDNKRLKEFSAVLDLLKGVYFYLSNDFRKATSYFKENHEIFFDLTLIELKYYEEAFAFFAKFEQRVSFWNIPMWR